ncbi:MAG: mevalonate kinase, partial [Candidatus Micrarchaeales archaeon]
MIAEAPGVIKLFGEHAVVYNRLALSSAVSLKAKVKATPSKNLSLVLKDLKKRKSFTIKEAQKIYKKFEKSEEEKKEKLSKDPFLPFISIFVKALEKSNKKIGVKAEISSQIPIASGFASSAACSSAFTIAISKILKLNLKKEELIELANYGDIVAHLKPSGIDVATSMLGGFVAFRKSEGAKKLNFKIKLKLIAAYAGERKTSEMVKRVASFREQDRWGIEAIFDKIENTTLKGINALREKDLEAFGIAMDEAQEYLRELGVSNNEIERIVSIARIYGGHAKISGAGGG